MRLYKFLSSEHALQDIRRRRVKISEIHDLNDPFELLSCDLSDPNVRLVILKFRENLAGNRGLLCFSGAWANPVLWAHYSDKHRGMCLGFDVPDDVTQRIGYASERIPWRKPDEDFMSHILYTKFAGWAYEGEVRVYTERTEEDNGLYFADFNEKLKLKEVIAGHRCCVERSEILAALTSYAEFVEVRKARLSSTTFEVIEDANGFTS